MRAVLLGLLVFVALLFLGSRLMPVDELPGDTTRSSATPGDSLSIFEQKPVGKAGQGKVRLLEVPVDREAPVKEAPVGGDILPM